jgi:colanic acid/amylovoran biosynthesis glycosyltransferase
MNKKLKIAVCAHDYPNYVSGPNVWMLRFISGLQQEGAEVIVLFTRGGEGSEYRYVNAVRERGSKCYVYNGSVYTEHKVKWILNVIRSENPDIFIPNLDVPAFFAARWIREAGIPTIGLLRSDDRLYMSILDQFIRKPGPFQPSAIVGVSDYLYSLAKSEGPSTILYRQISSGTPIPEKVAKNNGGILRLIYTGRLIEQQKRISDVTRALCEVTRDISGTEAVIYGSGDSLDSILNIIKTSGIESLIWYGGVLEADNIQKSLLEGHVFVLLSDYEGLPTSLIEAMACGLVPVCLNIRSGIPELVENERTGLLVDNRDRDFSAAVYRLKNEKGLWERLSKGARNKIKSDYSIEKSIEKWNELFSELLHKSKTPKLPVRIPKRYRLPNSHPESKGADIRWPGYIRLYGNKGKNIFKKICVTLSP